MDRKRSGHCSRAQSYRTQHVPLKICALLSGRTLITPRTGTGRGADSTFSGQERTLSLQTATECLEQTLGGHLSCFAVLQTLLLVMDACAAMQWNAAY